MSNKKMADAPKCQYNAGVDCYPQQKRCNNCGWNPAVAKQRLNKFCVDKVISAPGKRRTSNGDSML